MLSQERRNQVGEVGEAGDVHRIRSPVSDDYKDHTIHTNGIASPLLSPSPSTFSHFAPAERVDIQWKDIRMNVQVKTQGKKVTKHILNGISGHVEPGKLLAILGPTGSGKSSLMNCLAGRVPEAADVSGEVLVNGRKVDSSFKYVSGYVMQDDLLFSQQTVYETLLLSALLRLPSKMPKRKKIERVEEVIQELGLGKARDTKIGDAYTRGISGGERKRVSVGIELVRKVSTIFLDEPTSGLDSFMAYNVMKTLSDLAHESTRTVVCTIHQPRSNIFELFDSILLLSEGEVMYFGDARDSSAYFDRLHHPCPEGFNYADHFLDIISLDHRTPELDAKSQKRVDFFASEYRKHEQHQIAYRSSAVEIATGVLTFAGSNTGPNWFIKLILLFQRSFQQIIRNKFSMFVQLFQSLFFAFLIGGIFYELGLAPTSVQDRVGVLFFIVLNQGFGGLFQVIQVFPQEKAIFRREHQSGFYTTLPYYLSKVLSELPLVWIYPLVFLCISYFMVGLQPGVEHFMILFAIVVMSKVCALATGLAIGSAAPTFEIASLMAPMIMIMYLLLSGLYINLDNISIVFHWIQYISFVRYGYSAAMINELTGLKFTGGDIPDGPRFETGEQVLEFYALHNDNVFFDLILMIVLAVATAIVGYILLRCTNPRPKAFKPLAKKI